MSSHPVVSLVAQLLIMPSVATCPELYCSVGVSYYLVMWLLSAISLELGIFVSNFARNEGKVIPFIPLVLISVLVSGVILPVEKLTEWAQILSYASPLYYANEIIQHIIADGDLRDVLNVFG